MVIPQNYFIPPPQTPVATNQATGQVIYTPSPLQQPTLIRYLGNQTGLKAVNSYATLSPLTADNVNFSKKDYLSRINEFPDYKQSDIPDPIEKKTYCGPASAANGLECLSKEGYPSLASPNLDILANYFKTNQTSPGTTTLNMCTGLENYLKDRGLTPAIEYQGIRDVPQGYKTRTYPNINSINRTMEKNGFVLLNLGIYDKSKPILDNKAHYKRDDGHWVTAVGHYSKNGKDYIVIHDPYASQNKNFDMELNKINNGKFITKKHDDEARVTGKAKDFYEAKSDLDYLGKNQVCVIDGAINLEVLPEKNVQ